MENMKFNKIVNVNASTFWYKTDVLLKLIGHHKYVDLYQLACLHPPLR